jgi:hypothetical protein
MIRNSRLFARAFLFFLAISAFFLLGYTLRSQLTILSEGWERAVAVSAGIIISILLAFVKPFWERSVYAPSLRVEISSIERKIADDVLVNIRDIPELAAINGIISQPQDLEPPRHNYELTIKELDELLLVAKQEIDGLPKSIEVLESQVSVFYKLMPQEIAPDDIIATNLKLGSSLVFDELDEKARLEAIKNAYKEKIDEYKASLETLSRYIQPASIKILEVKNELKVTRAYFEISSSLINSGGGATAIKIPAMLRIYIGIDRNVDLELALHNAEAGSEVAVGGIRIVTFRSEEIRYFHKESRDLINRYWNNDNNSKLFIQDIHTTNYASNYVVFAEGLHHRHVYQQLSRFADEHRIATSPINCAI